MSSFCTAKATHIFSAKKFQHICVSLNENFNESLTNVVVSFEQLGPDVYILNTTWFIYAIQIVLKSRFTMTNIDPSTAPLDTCSSTQFCRVDSSTSLWKGPFLIEGVSSYFFIITILLEIPIFSANSVIPDQKP